MAMGSTGGGGLTNDINVTPMIDVMLVLLIIFMLVVPAINSGFQAIPPQGVNLKPHPEEERDQVLGIDMNGQYFLNKKAIPNAQLGELHQVFIIGPEHRAPLDEFVLEMKNDAGVAHCASSACSSAWHSVRNWA